MEAEQSAFTLIFIHNVSEETKTFEWGLELRERSDYRRKVQVTESPEVDGSIPKQAAES